MRLLFCLLAFFAMAAYAEVSIDDKIIFTVNEFDEADRDDGSIFLWGELDYGVMFTTKGNPWRSPVIFKEEFEDTDLRSFSVTVREIREVNLDQGNNQVALKDISVDMGISHQEWENGEGPVPPLINDYMLHGTTFTLDEMEQEGERVVEYSEELSGFYVKFTVQYVKHADSEQATVEYVYDASRSTIKDSYRKEGGTRQSSTAQSE